LESGFDGGLPLYLRKAPGSGGGFLGREEATGEGVGLAHGLRAEESAITLGYELKALLPASKARDLNGEGGAAGPRWGSFFDLRDEMGAR
jgi:hypothetical protein